MTGLTDEDFQRAAETIGCDAAAVRAVVAIEAGGSGFFPSGKPKMLPERHYFWRLLKDQPDKQAEAEAAGLAYESWRPGNYPVGENACYALLARMMDIDETAALQSCSWGIGQVMGVHWEASGYCSIQALVAAMCASEAAQLDLMISFIVREKLGPALVTHDWALFARKYNGPGYAANNYDDKLEAAYARFS